MTVEAVVAQTPGKGWRWRTVDTGVTIDRGLSYHATASAAEDDAVRALGTGWPGTPTEVFDTIGDAEEDGWHLVGGGGSEPAFGDDWENAGTYADLAFTLTTSGEVRLYGSILRTGVTTGTVVVLPADYRPASGRYGLIAAVVIDTMGAPGTGVVLVDDTGAVTVLGATTTDTVIVNGSYPAELPAVA